MYTNTNRRIFYKNLEKKFKKTLPFYMNEKFLHSKNQNSQRITRQNHIYVSSIAQTRTPCYSKKENMRAKQVIKSK